MIDAVQIRPSRILSWKYEEIERKVVDLYIEPVFFISRDYQWGCLTNQKKVYVFGDKFRELVAQKANELGLKICI